MDLKIVLAFSVLLQSTAAFLALRLIRLTGRRKAWLLISAAISLMVIRRSITLWRMLSEGLAYPPDPAAEWVALATSVLLVSGVAFIGPLFVSIKQSEEAQRKINRALRILSSVNEVIIRSTEESTLLKDVCRTIVEGGGYCLVWVGFAEQNEEKIVRPVAHAGQEKGYLDTMNFTWADTGQGRSPAGKAIQTGNPCMAKNILTDPDYVPWRDEATKRGYASSIAIPLIDNSQTFGALTIYAEEPDAFDEGEVKLLTELANDLTYGIMALRSSAERRLAEDALRKSEEELQKRVKELEEFYDMAIGRELRMIELKEEIESLKEELGKYKK